MIEHFNGRRLLTLCAPYATHLQVRRLLRDYYQLSGQSSGLAQNYIPWNSKSSSAVEVPCLTGRLARKRNRRPIFGGGGFGGGGGVF